INVGIKSGTNSLHGTAYAFGRDASATDAGNAFRTAGVSPVTPATLEQFGASAGGRIIKDKLFWFANYEGLRDILGDTAVVTIPSDISLASPSKPQGDPNNSMVDACNTIGRANVNPLSANWQGFHREVVFLNPPRPPSRICSLSTRTPPLILLPAPR